MQKFWQKKFFSRSSLSHSGTVRFRLTDCALNTVVLLGQAVSRQSSRSNIMSWWWLLTLVQYAASSWCLLLVQYFSVSFWTNFRHAQITRTQKFSVVFSDSFFATHCYLSITRPRHRRVSSLLKISHYGNITKTDTKWQNINISFCDKRKSKKYICR